MRGLSPLFKRKGGSDAQKTWRLAERLATIILAQLTTKLGVNLIFLCLIGVEEPRGLDDHRQLVNISPIRAEDLK
jgi:hypothetical protein